jgi:hypothetical protein
MQQKLGVKKGVQYIGLGRCIMQKAITVNYQSEKKNNLSELNQLLQEGWKVVSQSPVGLVPMVSSLVILEKN